MILYSYFRSSAAYRVRIALNLKSIQYQTQPIHLLNDGGQQHSPNYHLLNPLELVPVLRHDQHNISQSLAIIDYLEDLKKSPPLYPTNIVDKIACKEFALSIACDVHPINNLRVTDFLKKQHGLTKQQITDWNLHWINIGFQSLEERLAAYANKEPEAKMQFCFAQQASLADICLIPQVYNGLRHNIDMSIYPLLDSIYQHCITLPEFKSAAPEQQPDAPI